MTTSMIYFECFNNKLDELLSELVVTFPEMTDLKVLKNGLNLAKTLDVKMAQNIFNQHVANTYETQILNQDEHFFLNEDYEEITLKHGVDLDIIKKLKSIWKELEDATLTVLEESTPLDVIATRAQVLTFEPL